MEENLDEKNENEGDGGEVTLDEIEQPKSHPRKFQQNSRISRGEH